MAQVKNLWLVTQRKPLESVEPIWWLRWVLRRYFAWRGFACRSHSGDCQSDCYASIEYRGVFDDEGIARHLANQNGGACKQIPYNAALPEETVQYGVGDVPQSEASAWYRRGVLLPFRAMERSEVEQMEAKIEQIIRTASA